MKLILSDEEKAAYFEFFKQTDKTSKGIVLPNDAVTFLLKSGLPQETLGLIWTLADSEKKGVLVQDDFFKALKWIAVAQSGKVPSLENLNSSTGLPVFHSPPVEIKPQVTGSSIHSAHSNVTGSQASMHITSEEREWYAAAFGSCGPTDGFITGESARDVFLQSKLPVDILGKVWALVDSVGAGKISQNQFLVAMVIIARLRSGQLSSVPASIPQSLWNSITSGNDSGTVGSKGSSTTSVAPAVAQPIEDVPWIIPESDQKQFAAFFDKLDKTKSGFVTGEQSYSFFLKSKLSEESLAIIWELSDFNKQGKLSKEEFILAMYLIKEKMGGKDLPSKLPVEYIPVKFRVKNAGLSSRNPSIIASEAASNIPADLQATSNGETDETRLLQAEMKTLEISISEIQEKKESYQTDLQSILIKKKEIESQIASLKMTYDDEMLRLSEIQGSLKRETLELEKANAELKKMQEMVSSATSEKAVVAKEMERVKEENLRAKTMIQTFTEQANTLKSELDNMQMKLRDDSRFLEMNQKLANDAKSDAEILFNQVHAVKQQIPTNQDSITPPINNLQQSPATATSVTSGKLASPAPISTSNPKLANSSPIEADPFDAFRVSTSSAPAGGAPPIPTTKKPIKSDILEDKNEIDALLNANKPKKDTSRPTSGKSDIVKSPPKTFEMAFSDIIDVDAEFSAAFADTPTHTSVSKPAVSFENAFDLTSFGSPAVAAPESNQKAFDLNSPIVWNDNKDIKLSDEDLNSAFIVEKDVAKLLELGFSREKSISALTAHSGDLQKAIASLLSES